MKFAHFSRELFFGITFCWTVCLTSSFAQENSAASEEQATSIENEAQSTTVLTDPNVLQAPCNSCDDGSCSSCMDVGDCGIPTCGTMCGCVSLYGKVEYLLWWDKGTDLPPLVTASPDGTPRADAAVLGFSSVLYGSDDVDDQGLFGERVTLGTFIGDGTTGIFGRFFFLQKQDSDFATNSTITPIFGRPFFNITTDQEDSVVLGFPNDTSGSVNVDWESETLGVELLVRQLFRANCNYRMDLVYGYRYFKMEESLRIDSSLEFIDPTQIFFGTQIDQFDAFHVDNEFHGFDLGLMGHSVDGCWTLDFVAKVAFGHVNHRSFINGSTTTTPVVGAPVVSTGGLLAQNSNIGSNKDDQFAVMPEFGTTLSYALTPRIDISVGYNFIYINRLARTSSVIDRSVNLLQGLGGEQRPAPILNETDYWLQGLTFGLAARF